MFPNRNYNPSILQQDSVQKQTAESTVAVQEWMDTYEFGAILSRECVRIESLRVLRLVNVRIQFGDEVLHRIRNPLRSSKMGASGVDFCAHLPGIRLLDLVAVDSGI